MTTTDIRTRLAEVGREFYERGWKLATGGNLSALAEGGVAVVTASGGHKGRLTYYDFVEVRVADGSRVCSTDRKPSAETIVHLALYRTTTARAVVHVHSPYVTLLSRTLEAEGLVRFEGWEFVKALGFWEEGAVVEVPIVPNLHALPALGDAVARAAGSAPAVLVSGHGVYAWGDSIEAAQRHAEATEFMCQMEWELARRG